MNQPTSHAPGPTLADVQRQHPRWRCWQRITGRCYTRRADALPEAGAEVTGENPVDLRDQIRHTLTRP